MVDVSRPDDLQRLSNQLIAVLALNALGGARSRIDTEPIAVRCYELAPRRFSWKTRDHPNMYTTVQALIDARRQRNDALVGGGPKIGWLLTPAGVDWIESHPRDVAAAGLSGASNLRLEQTRALKRIADHAAFMAWRPDAEPLAPFEAASAVYLPPDAPARVIADRIAELSTFAQSAGFRREQEYLEWLKQAFNAKS